MAIKVDHGVIDSAYAHSVFLYCRFYRKRDTVNGIASIPNRLRDWALYCKHSTMEFFDTILSLHIVEANFRHVPLISMRSETRSDPKVMNVAERQTLFR